MTKITLLSQSIISSFSLSTITAVGGEESSGFKISGLKYKDDYGIFIPSATGVIIHPLKGSAKGPQILNFNDAISIDDLKVGISEEKNASVENAAPYVDHYLECIQALEGISDLSESMQTILNNLTSLTFMEKGLIILKNVKGDFELVAQKGILKDDSWLSEKLIQSTLSSQKSLVVQNIVGSSFEQNKSLMASGFISFMTWPLIVRNESLGVMILGSVRPHSGLTTEQSKHCQNLAQLAALMLWFRLRETKLREEVSALKENQNLGENFPLLTTDKKLLTTLQLAKQVAATDLSLVIQGETGVGKELLSQWIHRNSERSRGPFVAVNCGAIPSELLESLLFGHKKGSFTNAFADHIGKFQAANGGTLFLDEIGDLPLALQVKLLRVLQERLVEPVGDTKPIAIDVRIIVATHKNLSELVAKNIFREDLFFRLSELTLYIPPLRERASDIGLLATEFLKSVAASKRFSTQGWNWLKSREWRGNGRELFSTVKRAAILSTNTEISMDDLKKGEPPQMVRTDDLDWLGGETLDEAKGKFIQQKVQQALDKAGGQRTKAAELLGITPRTLFRYLENRDVTEMS